MDPTSYVYILSGEHGEKPEVATLTRDRLPSMLEHNWTGCDLDLARVTLDAVMKQQDYILAAGYAPLWIASRNAVIRLRVLEIVT